MVPNLRYADDAINMPVQCATHWDALGHIFYEEKMYNGFDARLVDCNGLGKLGIEHAKSQDGRARRAARHRPPQGRARISPDGHPISNDDLDRLRQGAERRDPPRRFRDPAHRPDGALPRGKAMGRLCGRRRAGREIRELLLVPGEGDRGDLLRHLGGRGAAQRDHRGQPALALGGDPRHGADHGRDVLSQGPGRGLRGRPESTNSSSAARRW